jgi:hemerythrin-like domain-containing protein
MNAIDTLMAEHRVIVQTLSALESYGQAVYAGDDVPIGDALVFANFFQDFADKSHHGKEENILFEQMAAAGFSKSSGPLGVMYLEHDQGRAHVQALLELGQNAEWTEALRSSVAEHISGFVPLLNSHIHKEDNILYPMASSQLGPDAIADISTKCEAFDAGNMDGKAYEHFSAQAAELTARYPA